MALNRLRDAGVQIDVAIAITGHSLATALKYYRKVSPKQTDAALDLVARRFEGTSGT